MAADTIHVACASDANYALPLAVMLASLTANLAPDREVEVHALDDGIPPADKERIRRAAGERAHVHWIPAGELPPGLVTWGRITLTTYHKLNIAHWVPAPMSRVLWLDADLLIRTDVTPLWQTPLDGSLALAAIDERTPVISQPGAVAAWRELGIDPQAKHFNAGVMSIDLDAWRRENIATRSFEYLQAYADRVYYWDQEALNALLVGRWRELDTRWNSHPALPGAVPIADPFISHFSGNLKPWNYTCDSGAWVEYYRYLDGTPWAGWRPKPTWRGSLTALYQSSGLRRILYPAEGWAIGLLRAATATYSRKKDGV